MGPPVRDRYLMAVGRIRILTQPLKRPIFCQDGWLPCAN